MVLKKKTMNRKNKKNKKTRSKRGGGPADGFENIALFIVKYILPYLVMWGSTMKLQTEQEITNTYIGDIDKYLIDINQEADGSNKYKEYFDKLRIQAHAP